MYDTNNTIKWTKHVSKLKVNWHLNSYTYVKFNLVFFKWLCSLKSYLLAVSSNTVCVFDYLHFLGFQNSCRQQMLQRWEPLLNREADESENQNETQVHVTDDGSPH